MYWTDTGSVPKIERASMDGTLRIVLHGSSLSTPYGLTLDIDTQTLYWMDYGRNILEKSSVDGTNRTILTSRMISYPYFLSYYDGHLYWGDWGYNRLLTTSISSPNNVAYFGSSVGSNVYGIHVISPEKQHDGQPHTISYNNLMLLQYNLILGAYACMCLSTLAPNPCAQNNGNCSRLCLLSSSAQEGYVCACPDVLINFDEDQNICRGKTHK